MLIVIAPSAAFSADAIGYIHSLKTGASILRGGVELSVVVGTPLNQGDVVRTGKVGAVSMVMTDDTSISLGPNSEISLDGYSFEPKSGKFSLVVRMAKGTFAYLAGLIGKLAPGSIQLLIPDAIIAVRGTKLLVEVQE
jgi:hypothetical protein